MSEVRGCDDRKKGNEFRYAVTRPGRIPNWLSRVRMVGRDTLDGNSWRYSVKGEDNTSLDYLGTVGVSTYLRVRGHAHLAMPYAISQVKEVCTT